MYIIKLECRIYVNDYAIRRSGDDQGFWGLRGRGLTGFCFFGYEGNFSGQAGQAGVRVKGLPWVIWVGE